MPDIDIDFLDRDIALQCFKHVAASRVDNSKHVKHNTGIYMHEVPVDALTNLCSVPYKEAEDNGYFKIDFLNVSIYKGVRDEEHLTQLMETEPLWELLEHQEFVDKVFHLSGHSEILRKLKPTNVEELAAVLAIIRPAKRHLVNETWETIQKEVWTKPEDGSYYFKKSHAVSYAVACIVHMNMLCQEITN